MVEYIDIFNGGSAMVLLVMGISFGIYYFIQYGKTKKNMLPLVAIVFILLGIFYLGPVTSFIALHLTGSNISGELYGYLSYSLSPVTTPIAMVLGFWIFKTEWRFKILWFFIPLALLYWFFLIVMPFFGLPAFEYSEVPGRLLDVSHSGACLYLAAVYILAVVVILGGGFFYLSSRIRGTPEFKKSLFLGIGWVLFGIAGVMDALLSDSFPNIIFIARGLMIFSFIFVFTGFLPSKQAT
jgi:hypothetical protein